jgi:hypothetical protein
MMGLSSAFIILLTTIAFSFTACEAPTGGSSSTLFSKNIVGSTISISSQTASPTPSVTDIPTAAPIPTATPAPTATPVPTATNMVASFPPTAAEQANLFATAKTSPHPRLLWGTQASDLLPFIQGKIQKGASTSSQVFNYYTQLKAYADKLVAGAAISDPRASGGTDILWTSRDAEERMTALSVMYRITGNVAYANAGLRDLTAIMSFTDWEPSDFLATAEMTYAASMGFDGFHDWLTPAFRTQLINAIYQKGWTPFSQQYVGALQLAPGVGWPNTVDNWNTVCNSAMLASALAVSGEVTAAQQPLLSQNITYAFNSLVTGVSEFYADGGFPEGSNYWSYANRYLVVLMSSFETSTGSDLALGNLPSIANTGYFITTLVSAPLAPVNNAATAPCGTVANYGDAPAMIGNQSAAFYYALRFGDPVLLQSAENLAASGLMLGEACDPSDPPNFGTASFLFEAQGEQRGLSPSANTQRALDQEFLGPTGMASLRGSWTDPMSASAFIKGGSVAQNHGHLNLGGVIFNWAGTQWISESPGENYGVPDYFVLPERWSLYRASTLGQSELSFCTLSGNGCNNAFSTPTADYCGLDQCSLSTSLDSYSLSSFNGNSLSFANLSPLLTTPQAGSVSLDLNADYANIQWTRTLKLGATTKYGNRTMLEISDSFATSSPSCFYAWTLQTSVPSAVVSKDGESVSLSDGLGHSVVIEKDPNEPQTAGTFNVQNIVLDSPQLPAGSLKRISYTGSCVTSGALKGLGFLIEPQ